MLSSRVVDPPPPDPEQEDIFSAAIGALFTDDVKNSHGTPGQNVIYRSPRFGDIFLSIPAHPDAEKGRQLFAHYLWNAAVIVADAIESASSLDLRSLDGPGHDDAGRTAGCINWNREYWDVKGKRILELGAGTALPSLVASLCEASTATITDHPSSPALTTGAIDSNVRQNLFNHETSAPGHPEPSKWKTSTNVTVHGYVWGTDVFLSRANHGQPSYIQPRRESFDRIIIADCLWMPSQHANLVKTILDYLDPSDGASCALVVAGFHTGRATVANFFDVAVGGGERSGATETSPPEGQSVGRGESAGADGTDDAAAVRGRLRAAEMFEIDVDGNQRAWEVVREGEDKQQAKRWCVCAILMRR